MKLQYLASACCAVLAAASVMATNSTDGTKRLKEVSETLSFPDETIRYKDIYSYDSKGMLTSIKRTNAEDGKTYTKEEYKYDAQQRLVSLTRYDEGEPASRDTYIYNAAGDTLCSAVEACVDGVWSTSCKNTYIYIGGKRTEAYELHAIQSEDEADDYSCQLLHIVYNGMGKVTKTEGYNTLEWEELEFSPKPVASPKAEYDALLKKYSFGDMQKSVFTYDNAGRATSEVATGPNCITYNMTYNAQGQLMVKDEIFMPDGDTVRTTITYNAAGRPTSSITGSLSDPEAKSITTIRYDEHGDTLLVIDGYQNSDGEFFLERKLNYVYQSTEQGRTKTIYKVENTDNWGHDVASFTLTMYDEAGNMLEYHYYSTFEELEAMPIAATFEGTPQDEFEYYKKKYKFNEVETTIYKYE